MSTYATAAEATTYCTTYRLDALASDTADAYLVCASVAIDRLYGARFIGQKTTDSALQWPRTVSSNTDTFGNERDFTIIPVEVVNATIELAVMLQDGLDPYAQPAAPSTEDKIKIDVIEISTKSAGTAIAPLYKIGVILSPLLGAFQTMRLVRG
jgi:hypothetical protein